MQKKLRRYCPEVKEQAITKVTHRNKEWAERNAVLHNAILETG